MTERKGASRCNTAARAFLRVIQDHVQNGGLVGDVAAGVGGVALKADAFARLNDNGLLISRDFDCTGEKGDKLGGTPQMRLRLPMAAGSQLHIVDGELPVFIVRKKAVRRYIENYQKPDFDLAIQGTLRRKKPRKSYPVRLPRFFFRMAEICAISTKPLRRKAFRLDGLITPTLKAAGSNPVGRTMI